jgi:hypothetical protein
MELQPVEYDTSFITPLGPLRPPHSPPGFHIIEPQLSTFLAPYEVKRGEGLHPHLLKEAPIEKRIKPIHEQQISFALMNISGGKGSLKVTSQGMCTYWSARVQLYYSSFLLDI